MEEPTSLIVTWQRRHCLLTRHEYINADLVKIALEPFIFPKTSNLKIELQMFSYSYLVLYLPYQLYVGNKIVFMLSKDSIRGENAQEMVEKCEIW